MKNHWQAMWELMYYSLGDLRRKQAIRNIMRWGFSAREAIDLVQSVEKEP